MADEPSDTLGRLGQTLTSGRNWDGGWGYCAGKASRLEPTCWGLLSELETGASADDRVRATVSLLAGWQRPDGLLGDIPGAPPNLAFNGLAALVVRRLRVRRPAGLPDLRGLEMRLLENLSTAKGVAAGANDALRQDNRLQGWPWIADTFSWVEPTALCLLALKKARPVFPDLPTGARVAEAESLLGDRCCVVGGWNYGNANVLGRELHPYVPTTALGLLALQDRRGLAAVQRSLRWLRDHGTSEASGAALSLAAVAAQAYGEPPDALGTTLVAQAERTGFFGNLATTGMAVYAMTGSRHDMAAFTL
jgi:hypothetical protein